MCDKSSSQLQWIVLWLLFSTLCRGATPTLDIKLHSNTDSEKKAKGVIEALAQKYDLSPYIFTKQIVIQSKVIPHSHPILTLNTRQVNEPNRYLGVLLHEEIHRFFEQPSGDGKIESFISKMRAKFPNVPSEAKGGASDVDSTYVHLGVCYYELVALSKLLGEKEATQIFSTEDVYTWVRAQVLANREFIARSLEESGLAWKDATQS